MQSLATGAHGLVVSLLQSLDHWSYGCDWTLDGVQESLENLLAVTKTFYLETGHESELGGIRRKQEAEKGMRQRSLFTPAEERD
jgi:hypothetical protein